MQCSRPNEPAPHRHGESAKGADAVYILEYLEDRDNWRLRSEGGATLPIEGADRDEVLGRARQWVADRAPARLRIEDRQGPKEDELSFP